MRFAVLTTILAAAQMVGPAAFAASPMLPARSSAPPRSCFWSREVTGFSAPDDHTVYLRVGVRDVYRLDLMGACLNVDWTQGVALKTRAGADYICDGLDLELIVPDRPMGPQHCAVSNLRKLTPAEVAALPKKARP
jgi:hypothetical protein